MQRLSQSAKVGLTSRNRIWKGFATASKAGGHFDVVIIGGGMVGSSLACSLATSPLTSSLRVALIEPNPSKILQAPLTNPPDIRTSAISPRSQRLLQAVGAWEQIEALRCQPYNRMEVWDAQGGGSINFDSSQMGVPLLGYMVENVVVQSALAERLAALSSSPSSNLTTLNAVSVKKTTFPPSMVTESQKQEYGPEGEVAEIQLSDGTQLTSKLVVSAEGTFSQIREALTMPVFQENYRSKAFVASVKTREPSTIAYQRFLPTGPLALLPFGEYSNIVWSTTPEHADALTRMSEDELIEAINTAIFAEHNDHGILPKRLPFIVAPKQPVPPPVVGISPAGRGAFNLRFLHAKEYVRPRLALIGDTAHTVHPLAGQGVNLGFADVITLTKTLMKCVEAGGDLGDLTYLRLYQAERLKENVPSHLGFHTLKKLFEFNMGPVSLLRSAGLVAVDALSPVKDFFMKQALGSSTDIAPIGTAAAQESESNTQTPSA